MEKMTDEQKKESLECAKMNFENFERAFPVAATHPYYMVAKLQLDHGLGYSNEAFDAAEKELGL